ncbi:Ig-like domain-containing protein, partial [Serratia sp. T13T92]|uniref:Ig-like domain-containing protein n=1 Tax=Serratia sp. T13T92 TaxID=3397496 RepID=UPI0039DF7CB7
VQTNAQGVAAATLVSLVAAGNQVTAGVGSMTTGEKTSTFVVDELTSVVSALTSKPDLEQEADGKKIITFTATLTNANNNPVPNTAVTFTTSAGDAVLGTPTVTDTNGQATVTLKDGTVEAVTVTAKSAVNAADPGKEKTVNFVVGAINAGTSTFTVSKASILADNNDLSILTFTALDVSNHKITGLTDVTFSVNGIDMNDTNVFVGTVAETDPGISGIYTATLKSIKAGVATLRPRVISIGVVNIPENVTFVEPPKFTDIVTQVNPTNGIFELDVGFPTTAFTGATFTLNTNKPAGDYTWSSSQPADVSVDGDGIVLFSSKPAGEVTITATPRPGEGIPITYRFTVTSWFVPSGGRELIWDDVADYCAQIRRKRRWNPTCYCVRDVAMILFPIINTEQTHEEHPHARRMARPF